MVDTRWLSEEEQRSWRYLQMMQMRLTARLARDLAGHSPLSYQDYAVLVALTDQPDGRVRLFELAASTGWEKSRLSHHVSRMAERGLVVKHTCASDRRGAIVEVSPRGRRELAAAAPSHVDAVRRLFVDQLSAVELAELGRMCALVLAAVEAEDRATCHEHEPACDAGTAGRADPGTAGRADPGETTGPGDTTGPPLSGAGRPLTRPSG